ncbi:MAG: nicotinate-nucleotide adenylyltransferase [Eubacteriaceae bacterium]|nr:nicotinate-nucleotide adenylyltransferase [Eubacteriaceae bacterium]
MKKFGILGGSFNPIHLGHLILAEQVKNNFDLDKIIFIPTTDNPLKNKLCDVNKYDRFTMTSLAVEDNDYFEVSDIEIKNTGYSYTINTIEELLIMDSSVKYYFICGADIIFYLERWKEFEKLFKYITFIAAYRTGYDTVKLQDEVTRLKEKYGADIIIFKTPLIDISSTQIRKRLKESKSVKYLIPQNVYSYITQKGLYKE